MLQGIDPYMEVWIDQGQDENGFKLTRAVTAEPCEIEGHGTVLLVSKDIFEDDED